MINRSKIVNFRALGSHLGHGGLKVKPNHIFRSGNLNLSTHALGEELDPFEIDLVFDLRSHDEIRLSPYVLPKHIQYHHKPVLQSFENGANEFNAQFNSLMSGSLDQSISLDLFKDLQGFMLGIYEEMAHSPKVFGEMMLAMIENEGKPVLFHCSAGKDRTGVFAAIILLALGVDEEVIKEDYLLSNKYRQEALDVELDQVMQALNNRELVEELRNMLIVKAEYLDLTLALINQFDSFEAFAQAELGLSLNDLEKFRNLYLE